LHEKKERLKREFYEFVGPVWVKPIRVYAQTKPLIFNIIGTDYIAEYSRHGLM
jgi:hypothetical protein